jgi:hypothetical protein
MIGGAVFKHIEKDKFLVSNTGEGKDINNTVIKFVLKDLKEVLSAYGVETKKKKKQELLDDFIKLTMNVPIPMQEPKVKKPRTKKVTEPEMEEDYDNLSSKLQQLIYVTPIKKISDSLAKLNYRGKISTNKILLNLNVLQNFDTIPKLKKLIDLLSPEPIKEEPRAKAKKAKKVVKAKEVKFEPLEEMMDTTPKSKNIQIKKPFRLSPELERASDPARLPQLLPIRSEREDELLEMEDDELKDIINDNEIKLKKRDKQSMINAILKKEKIVKGTVLPEKDYDDLVQQHNILNLKNNKGDRSLYAMYRTLDTMKNKLAQMRNKPTRDTTAELFEDLKIKRFMQRISDIEEILLKDITKGKKGGSISASSAKLLLASSYKTEPDKEINGWIYDDSISKQTARVYYNDSKKQAVVVHRGTEGTVKDWANNLAFVAGVSPLTKRYKDSKEVQEKAESKYDDVLTLSHSQGSVYSKLAKNKRGIIDINPASFLQSTVGTTVRSATDPVSALRGVSNLFSKNPKNITTSAKVNPLQSHSIDILDELPPDQQLGTGLTKYLKGLKRGGDFKTFFKKTLPRVLVKQGIPLAMSVGASSLGSIGGPITGLVSGEVGAKAGELLADDISKKAGLGLTLRLKQLGR